MFLFWSSVAMGRLAIMRSMRWRSTGEVGERSWESSTPPEVSILAGTGTGAATAVSEAEGESREAKKQAEHGLGW
jgi:hypothetical protein